jgi:predicted regulator of Ras-like GTPase activity (Roadblock/LC7/MglB family)
LLLQDVLQNLPSDSLKLRGDQEDPEETSAFETPFSKKASEDAARMKVSAVPIAKSSATTEVAVSPEVATAKTEAKPVIAAAEPAVQPGPTTAKPTVQAAVTPPAEVPLRSTEKTPVELAKKTPKSVPVAKEEILPETKPAAKAPPTDGSTRRTALQNLLDTNEPLDAKTVLIHVSRLPGVSSCAIVFSDGLSLAGNIPADYEADALCATAPSIIKRISEQMLSAKFGALCGVTLYCSKTPVTLFAHGNICLAAVHSGDEIAAEVRDRLGRTTQELARMYAQPA